MEDIPGNQQNLNTVIENLENQNNTLCQQLNNANQANLHLVNGNSSLKQQNQINLVAKMYEVGSSHYRIFSKVHL